MVTKVGSAGQVIESVISYQQSTQANRPETAPEPVQKKKEAPEVRGTPRISLAPDRNRDSSDVASEIRTRNANSLNKNTIPVPPPSPQPVQSAAVMETANGEVIENRENLELSPEAVKITVDDVNKKISSMGASIEFSYHEKTGRYSFKVMDVETGKVLREVPPTKSLDMVAKMFEMAGLIIDEKR